MFSYQQAKKQSRSKTAPSSERSKEPLASNAERLPHFADRRALPAAVNLSQIPVHAPGREASTAATPWASRRPESGPADGLRIDRSAIRLEPAVAEQRCPDAPTDGSLADLSEDQDSLTPSLFERKRRGVHIRVNGGQPGGTSQYPDGVRWVQTIDTNAPLFGQSPPYVDFVPPKDDKPFYFSDAMETSQGGTFSDSPSRKANNVRWDATLSLVGVSGHAVTRIDSVNYGFALDASGALTVHGPSSTGAGSVVTQGDTLRSEYPNWVFSGGFAVAQVPPAGTTASGQGRGNAGVVQASRADGIGTDGGMGVAAQTAGNAAPQIVHDVVASPGEPLQAGTRGWMESRFGEDFGRIRVHADDRAAKSAAAVGASAYTVGNHVVFGQRKYAPGTVETQRLLAHELRHTQQQGEAAGGGPLMVAPAGTELERDADEAARRAVSGDAGAGMEVLRAEPRLQRQRVQRQPEGGGSSQLRMPQVGESLRQPTAPLFPIPQLAFHLSAQDSARINEYLTTHRFSVGQRFQPTLDGSPTTIDAVVNAVQPLVLPLIPRSEIETLVQARYSVLVHDALFRAPISIPDTPLPDYFASAPAQPATAGTANPITLTAGTNFAWHVNLSGPRGTSSDKSLQLQIGEDAPLQRIFQISYNLDNQQVQVVVGGQATGDLTLVKDLLKLSGFVQVLAGVAWTGTPASGLFTVVQPSAGGQLTLTWHGVQFAVQAAGSVTGVRGQPTTAEFNVTPQITVPLGGGSQQAPKRTPSSELTGLFEVRDWVDNARYSELERLPTEEKGRLIRVLLGDAVIDQDVDAIARIWRSISSSGERQQIRPIIEASIPDISNPQNKARLQHLLTEQ